MILAILLALGLYFAVGLVASVAGAFASGSRMTLGRYLKHIFLLALAWPWGLFLAALDHFTSEDQAS